MIVSIPYSEVYRHLGFGFNLSTLRMELVGHKMKPNKYPYPTKDDERLRFQFTDRYVPNSTIMQNQLDSSQVPDKIIEEIRHVNPRIASLVSFGYSIGLWWQTRFHGGDIALELERGISRGIEDLQLPGMKGRLLEILQSYREAEFERQITQRLLSEIAQVLVHEVDEVSPPLVTEGPPPAKEQGKVKVLFLAANPVDEDQLRSGTEIRLLRLNLRKSEFEVIDEWATRADDLQRLLRDIKPHIVHFSGHGLSTGELILEDKSGFSHPVPTSALGDLFSLLKHNIRCVVLSACYAEGQAQVISSHIDCVVGMSREIEDDSALEFAKGFYEALGSGASVKKAYDLGCNRIHLVIDDQYERDVPKLHSERCDPRTVRFIYER